MFTQELTDLIIGLDVGKKIDRTVIALFEKYQEYGHDAFEGKNKVGSPFYILSHLERMPLDTPHFMQVDRVTATYNQVIKKFNKDLPANKRPMRPDLVIDLGNVGESHFEQYEAIGLNVYGINYLGDGAETTHRGNRYGVSKKNLTSALSILMENERLYIADDIPDRKNIIKELSKFTWKISTAGNVTAENLRDSDHDDIVNAFMVAAWYGEKGIRKIYTFDRTGLGI